MTLQSLTGQRITTGSSFARNADSLKMSPDSNPLGQPANRLKFSWRLLRVFMAGCIGPTVSMLNRWAGSPARRPRIADGRIRRNFPIGQVFGPRRASHHNRWHVIRESPMVLWSD